MSEVMWFDPVWGPLLSVIAITLATAVQLFLELRHRRRFKWARVISSIVMMLAIAGLIMRPSYKRTVSQTFGVLTPGYEKSDVDSLATIHPNMALVHSPGTPAYRNSTALPSTDYLDVIREHVAFVFGGGLGRAGLDILDSIQFQVIGSRLPQGILRLNVPKEIFPNQQCTLAGTINSSSANIKLVLSGPGGPEDSTIIEKPGLQPFELSFTPKQPGNFVYLLRENDTINEVPVVVSPERRLIIFIIQDYPTFEMRHLKEFLSRKHSLVIRNQLSRDRYRYEFINRAALSIRRLSSELLTRIDLLIIDNHSLNGLSPAEKTVISKNVRDGLGVLVTFNDNPSKAKTSRSILPVDFTPYPSDTALVHLPSVARTLKTWPVKPSADAVNTLIRNKNRVLAGYTSDGFGKVGFQLVVDSYELALSGDSVAFTNLWAPVLGELARQEVRPWQITFQDRFPYYQNVPLEFRITSSTPPRVTYDGQIVAMAEDVRIDDIWYGKIWPDRTGWNWLEVSGDSVAFYISADGAWRSLSMMNTISESTHHHSRHRPAQLTKSRVPVEPWIFFTLFLLSAAFLWLSPKL